LILKKVIVVGGGIAGLSAGIYALQSGFDVTILEQHSIPGGFCTSWKRGGYLFEGGLHWLTGSANEQALNKVWRNIGAICDDTKIYARDPFLIYDQNGKQACLYRDVEKLRTHLIEISPEDKSEIDKFCNDVKKFSKISMPLRTIKGIKVKEKSKIKLSSLFPMLPALMKASKYNKISPTEYAKRFKNPVIRGMIGNMIGDDYSAAAMMFAFGCFASGDGGFLDGGSLPMTQRIANRFKALGGKIEYNVKVEQVIAKNGKAVGVLMNGEKRLADSVIVTIDTAVAIDKLFAKPLDESWTDKMRSLKDKSMVNTFVCLGVEADLSEIPEYVNYALDKPFFYAGEEHKILGYEHYAPYEGFSPEGCTAVTVILPGDTYDFWKSHKENETYEAEKKKIADTVIEILSEKVPQIKGKVAVVDVATPLTYERYCGSYHGGWMTKVGKGEKMQMFQMKSEMISNLYFAGHRIQPPGGLPVAAETGRVAVQYLCKDNDMVFQGNME